MGFVFEILIYYWIRYKVHTYAKYHRKKHCYVIRNICLSKDTFVPNRTQVSTSLLVKCTNQLFRDDTNWLFYKEGLSTCCQELFKMLTTFIWDAAAGWHDSVVISADLSAAHSCYQLLFYPNPKIFSWIQIWHWERPLPCTVTLWGLDINM